MLVHYIGATFSFHKKEHEHINLLLLLNHHTFYKLILTTDSFEKRLTHKNMGNSEEKKEAKLIGRYQPSLNEQISVFYLSFYPTGIT